MRFSVQGANRDTGDEVQLEILALTTKEAEQIAVGKGIMISAIHEIKPKDTDETPIELEPDMKLAATGAPASAMTQPIGRAVTLDADQAGPLHHGGGSGETTHLPAGNTAHAVPTSEHLQYKVVTNQSLMLLETAVNRYLKDGWVPSGAMTVGMQNLAMIFFQAMVRHPTHHAGSDGHAGRYVVSHEPPKAAGDPGVMPGM